MTMRRQSVSESPVIFDDYSCLLDQEFDVYDTTGGYELDAEWHAPVYPEEDDEDEE